MIYFRIILYSFALVFYSCNPEEDTSGPSNDDIHHDIGVSLSYTLLDINPSSETYENDIGPQYFENMVTVHFFGHQTWGACTSRVEALNSINDELISEGYSEFKIIAIGKNDYNGSNSNWTNNNDIPILVDDSNNKTWNDWAAYQRSLFFLDSNQQFSQIINVHSSMNSNEVKELIILLMENNS